MTFFRKIFGLNDSKDKWLKGKTCHVCGRLNSTDVKFCSYCGIEFPVVYELYDAFISYRRETGSDLASLLKVQLENSYHKRIFLDVKELQVGRFDEALLKRIEETPNFILILSKASLDRCDYKNDWLKREIVHALKTNRNIIPLLIEGFSFPTEDKWNLLPSEMKIIASLNGVSYSHIHQDAAIRQIASYMMTVKELTYKLSSPKSGEPGVPEPKTGSEASTCATDSGKSPEVPFTDPKSTDSKPYPSDLQKLSSSQRIPDSIKIGSSISQEPPEEQVINNTPAKEIIIESEPKSPDQTVPFNTDHIIFFGKPTFFTIGAKDSKVTSFPYYPGTPVMFNKKGTDESWNGMKYDSNGWAWYQFPKVEDTDIWLTGYNAVNSIETTDKRIFFRINDTDHVGYLAELGVYDSIEEMLILDDQLGNTKIKIDQIVSITAKKDEMTVKTRNIGLFTGGMQKFANYNNYLNFAMGPCLVTQDSVVALTRTNRTVQITISRIEDDEKPTLIPESVYWDRSQLKFRFPARDAIGFFDENVKSSYINFTDKEMGWMLIYIPQINRININMDRKEAPVIIETKEGNIYKGFCNEKFNLSGTLISFDNVKSLVLEALERTPFSNESMITEEIGQTGFDQTSETIKLEQSKNKDISSTNRDEKTGKETTVKNELTFNAREWCAETYVELELISTSAKKNELFKKERAKPMNISVSGSLALLPVNEGVRAFDISDPRSPKFLSFFPAPYMSYKWIEFIKDRGLLRGNDGSFHLIDYKDPANAREIPFDNHFRNVFNNCGNGLLLYHKDILIDLCHAETCGVKVIDFSDEQDINKNVKTFGVIHFPAGCGTLSDDYLLLGSYKEPKMRIALLSETEVKEIKTLTIETSDGYLQPRGMAAFKGRLYIFGHGLSSPRPQLATYDLSNFPEEIELESIFELPGEQAVREIFGVQVYTSGNWLYYNDADQLFVYDLSRPEKPKLALVKNGPFYVTHISGNVMYCGDDRNLWIFKIMGIGQ
jgi:hypothetical protein